MPIGPQDQHAYESAMLQGLIDRLRANLRERLLAAIEPDLNKIIDEAIEDLKVTILSQREVFGDMMIKFLVEKKGFKP